MPDILPDILFQYNIITYVACREPSKTDLERPNLKKTFRKFQLDPGILSHPTFSTSGGTGFTFLAKKMTSENGCQLPTPGLSFRFQQAQPEVDLLQCAFGENWMLAKVWVQLFLGERLLIHQHG